MPKVMLVEDDITMRGLLETLLEMEGYRLAPSFRRETLSQVLDTIRAEKPDLILLDVNLRQFKGFELLRLLRSDHELAHTRVLMSSGVDYTDQAALEGADGFLLKPFMPEELVGKVRALAGIG